jgi:hypothetical protein
VKSLLFLLPALPLAAHASAPLTQVAALDMSTATHYDANFQRVFLTYGSLNSFDHTGGKLVHTAKGSGTVALAYDTYPDDTPDNLFRDVTVGFDFTTNSRNVSFGVYFGGTTRRQASLALFNLNTDASIKGPGANLTVRFFTEAVPATGLAGVPFGPVATLTDNSFASDGTTYRATLTVTYVTASTANVVLTIFDPINPLATFTATAEDIPVPPGGGEIGFRSGFLGSGGVNTFDNITISASRG